LQKKFYKTIARAFETGITDLFYLPAAGRFLFYAD